MKKIKSIFALTLLFLVLGCSSAMAADWTIDVNGQPIDAEVKIIEGRSLIPLRAVGESLGLEVVYYESTKTINLEAHDYISGTASIWIDWKRNDYQAIIGGYKSDNTEQFELRVNDFKMYVQPVNIDGRVYVPVRLICDSFGAPVKVTGNTISIGKIFTDSEYSVKKISKLIYSENAMLYIPEEAKKTTTNTGTVGITSTNDNTEATDTKAEYKKINSTNVLFWVDDYSDVVSFTDGMYDEGKALSVEKVEEIYDKSIKAVKRKLKDPTTATFNIHTSTDNYAMITDALDSPSAVYDGITGNCIMIGKVRAANSYGTFSVRTYDVVYDENWNVLAAHVH